MIETTCEIAAPIYSSRFFMGMAIGILLGGLIFACIYHIGWDKD